MFIPVESLNLIAHLCLSRGSSSESVARIIVLYNLPRRFLRRLLRIITIVHSPQSDPLVSPGRLSLRSDLWRTWQRQSCGDWNSSCWHFSGTSYFGWNTATPLSTWAEVRISQLDSPNDTFYLRIANFVVQ